MGIPIKRGIENIPGGMVIVPLSLGALIATFAPGTGQFFGSFTGALFTGALPILAVFYVCMGATIPFETLPQVAGKGGVLLAAKVGDGRGGGAGAGTFPGHRAGQDRHAGRAFHPGGGGGDQRHQWRALHGADGPLWHAAGRGRLFADVAGVRALHHHDDPGRVAGLSLADLAGRDPAAAGAASCWAIWTARCANFWARPRRR